MAGKTYKCRGVVLRKTKLGEKDLIVTLLDEGGSLVRAVAKGARKPGGSLAARLELFRVADLLLAKGRSLDIITSAAFPADAITRTLDVEQTACSSVLAELVAALAQENLPHARLYDMTCAAFDVMAEERPSLAMTVLCSASLKALAYAGYRPSFTDCVSCGTSVPTDGKPSRVALSIEEGGVVCAACPLPSDVLQCDFSLVAWGDALMRSRFDDVRGFEVDYATISSLIHLIRQWTRVHVGKNLKSIDFLLTCIQWES